MAVKKPPVEPKPQAASRAWEALTPALSEWILEATSSMGFERMTPVQASTIPLFTGNKDVVVEAVTGSGKTLAFLIPVIEKLLRLEEPVKKHHIGAIIISPTRELATQIHQVLLSLLGFHPPSAAHLDSQNADASEAPSFPSSALKIVPQLLLGGTTTPAQDLSHFLTHSPNLLISTPGRLLELLSSPHVHCPQSSFEVLVLDEADRLLDLGFKNDLQKILQRLPKQRRTGLFSASVSEAVDQLVRVGLRNPVRIAVKVRGRDGKDDQRVPASLQMTYLTTPPTAKLPALLTLLTHTHPQPAKSIAFLSTCAAVDYFAQVLPSLISLITCSHTATPNPNVKIIPLHGRLPPTTRSKNFFAFLTSTTPALLLTTDLAARGLDIPQVDLTIQLDPPSDPKTFLHRAGRAGRAGRKGLAVVFLTPGRESEGYPSFLEVRRTGVQDLRSLASDSDILPGMQNVIRAVDDTALASKFTQRIRDTVRKDRALHDKAQRGFVSWVRSYSKHTAASIFRVTEVDWAKDVEAWGLLRCPRMPEVKDNGMDRGLGLTLDWDVYAYKDPQKEKKRKAEMKERQDAAEQGIEKASSTKRRPNKKEREKLNAFSDRKEQAALAKERREKKEKKRKAQRWEGLSEKERARERETEGMIEKVRSGMVAET